ncbi:unnamed protein product [Vitrella brassicaformis CCMP3155]|uniref:Uncharacterized protein n=1 Tax=Vitrella brassicaformis (strain CCMP3155) TaxID=1169540 RepID=A0A0G4E857_VITBC|nr:unnamed protein product [Vitrella brassicaformis CCMP3155]|eukprot:CEL91654.1 unnamed protein product [Vitrella brassicaformis CCMP3155]
MEEGEWVEIGEVIELAGQCGKCELPVILTSDDINTHTHKTAYVSAPRVLSQLKMVGCHIHFSDDRCLQLFQHGDNQVRAIVDQPGFELEVDPRLPAGHLYQQHRQPHDPPVCEGIHYSTAGEWRPNDILDTDASLSSFAKRVILDHFVGTHQTYATSNHLNRHVGGGRLDSLFTQSPHTPVAGCSTTLSRDGNARELVLTDGSHSFVAWISIFDADDIVHMSVQTTESPVCVSGAFKDGLPMTTQLGSVALGRESDVFDFSVVQRKPSEGEGDDGWGGELKEGGGTVAGEGQDGAQDGDGEQEARRVARRVARSRGMRGRRLSLQEFLRSGSSRESDKGRKPGGKGQ